MPQTVVEAAEALVEIAGPVALVFVVEPETIALLADELEDGGSCLMGPPQAEMGGEE